MSKIPGKSQVDIEGEKFFVSVVKVLDWIATIKAL